MIRALIKIKKFKKKSMLVAFHKNIEKMKPILSLANCKQQVSCCEGSVSQVKNK
jgi:hypothetical protein